METNVIKISIEDIDKFDAETCKRFLTENWGLIGFDKKGILKTLPEEEITLPVLKMECKRQLIYSLYHEILRTLKF